MELQDRLFSENSGEVFYSISMTESEYALYSEFRESIYSDSDKKEKTGKRLAKDAAFIAGTAGVGAGTGVLIGKAVNNKSISEDIFGKSKERLVKEISGEAGESAGKIANSAVSKAVNKPGNDALLKKVKDEIAKNPHGTFNFDGKTNLSASEYLKRAEKVARRNTYKVSEMAEKIGINSEAGKRLAEDLGKKVLDAREAKKMIKHAKKGAIAGAGIAAATVAAKHLAKDN